MKWLGKAFDFEAGSILNFNKPKGRTSFWVVKQVRKLIKTKVGHSGTLDPFATGVLLICTGKATKQVSELMNLPKHYIGEIELGITTNTDDLTGAILKTRQIPDLTIEQIREICQSFIGDIYQLPPMFSAKKIKGRRLYKLARAGKVIERKPNLVHIEQIEVLSFSSPVIKIKVECSKGTYMRSLARDIGEKVGCGAHLKSLVRTQIGPYQLEDSLTIEDFDQMLKEINALK